MLLAPTTIATAPAEIYLGRSDVRLTPDCNLVTKAEYAIGDAAGYASIDDAIAAARALTTDHKPAAAVLANAGRFTLSSVKYYALMEPMLTPFHITNSDRAIRFDHADFAALVDGNIVVRAAMPGTYVPVR